MARSYGVADTRAQGNASYPIICIWQSVASPVARFRLYEFEIGSSATPADQATRYNVARISTLAPTGGTSLTASIQKVDPADPASGAAAMGAASATCTVETAGKIISVNQRASFRWVAIPTKEWVAAATQYAGIALVAAAQTGAYNMDTSLEWEES